MHVERARQTHRSFSNSRARSTTQVDGLAGHKQELAIGLTWTRGDSGTRNQDGPEPFRRATALATAIEVGFLVDTWVMEIRVSQSEHHWIARSRESSIVQVSPLPRVHRYDMGSGTGVELTGLDQIPLSAGVAPSNHDATASFPDEDHPMDSLP
ncbi:hypothetical protein OH77DRAFT_235567 [Trametes cingulata]|nr:hypothetical protein OH77DRAFT_235567 [Trametes cingulata]